MKTVLSLVRSGVAIIIGFFVMVVIVLLSSEILIRYTSIGSVPMGSPIKYTSAGLAVDFGRGLVACVSAGLTVALISNRWALRTVGVFAVFFSLMMLSSDHELITIQSGFKPSAECSCRPV